MSLVDITDGDGVRLLTWNRPEALNALNDDLWDATCAALVEAQADPSLRCVVLTGTGRAFTAGQDLGEMMAPRAHEDGQQHGYRALMPVLETFDKPLLAAVNGISLGIGVTLLPYCDIVWVAEGARLQVPFVTLGVTTEAASSLLLPQRMGWQEAAHFLFTASWMTAEEAVSCGLAWKVCPPDSLLDDVMAVAREIGAMGVDSIQTTKRLMVAARLDAGRAARSREDAEFARMVGSAENAAAINRFFS
jgi:enoyl-CoA hydratase/carnithine racemase